MKARLVSEPPRGDWEYEIKFDGFRALAVRGADECQLLSRNEKDLAGKFPEVVRGLLELKLEDAVIDGEIVALFTQATLNGVHQKLAASPRDRSPFPELPNAEFPRAAMRRAHWAEPKWVCQVKFSEWTNDGKLRQPVFLGLREDKNAAEVVREGAV